MSAVYRHWVVLYTGERAAEVCYLGTAQRDDRAVIARALDQVQALRCEGRLMRAVRPCEPGACDTGPGRVLAEVEGHWMQCQHLVATLKGKGVM